MTGLRKSLLILLSFLVAAVRRGTIGQKMLAVRSNERAAAAAGINVRQVKLTAFMVSAFIAGTAYWKRRAKAKAKAFAAAGGNTAAVVDMPAPREAASAPSSATRTVDKQLPVPVEKPGGTRVVPQEV